MLSCILNMERKYRKMILIIPMYMLRIFTIWLTPPRHQTSTKDMLRKAKSTHISSQTSQATKALWTASKWAQLVSSAREINPHWPHCTSWWSKISKSRLSWATWTLWPGMEATKSGWQEKIRVLLSPPSLYLTSTDHYIHFWNSSGGIAEVLSWASEANAF